MPSFRALLLHSSPSPTLPFLHPQNTRKPGPHGPLWAHLDPHFSTCYPQLEKQIPIFYLLIFFEQIVGELLETISAESLDGLLLSLHGAMVAEHIPDADGESVEGIRKTVGDSLPVVLTLDLHANVSQRMISNVSATTVYRTYPHLDQRERGREAARILADIIRGKIHPIQVLVKPPLEINILAQHTDREPMMGLYRKLEELMPKPGIIGN